MSKGSDVNSLLIDLDKKLQELADVWEGRINVRIDFGGTVAERSFIPSSLFTRTEEQRTTSDA